MRPRYPRQIERTYRALLDRRSRALHRALMAELRPAMAERLDGVRRDNQFDTAALLSIVRRVAAGFGEPATGPLLDVARQLDLFTSRQVREQVESAARKAGTLSVPRVGSRPGDAQRLYRLWIAENVSLIKTIDSRYFADIINVIAEGVPAGRNQRQLAKQFEQRFGVSRSRAKLIARDQTASLNAKVTETRQRELGVTRYTWRTSRDERVRDSHQALEGTVWSWSSPSPEGHPGEAIQCRCTAEPVID